jgi:ABC-type branched-subunit amino acid transport system substrate-binding protein
MKRLALALAFALIAPLAGAQIVIGQTSGFTGAVSAGVKENTDGAKLYLDAVNAAGGINGQKIELVSLDDKFDPKLAAENAKKLITEHNVVALFMSRGTPHTQAILPVLEQYKVPLVAPSTGAMVLHTPVNPWVFNVRAPYQRETEKAVQYLLSIGVTRIGLAHVDDSFGNDCAIGALRGFDKAHMRAAFVLKFDRDKPDFAQVVRGATKLDAQALILIGSAQVVAEGTKKVRQAGSKATIVTVSNNASAGFIKLMGDYAYGTIVTQIFPYERSLSAPIVKEAYDLALAKGYTDVTPAMLEGYAGAKVLVEGLKRAGPKPTPLKLRDALEHMGTFNIGGLEVTYNAKTHSGMQYADLAIIGPDGKFRR